ncbi:MAG: D-alanine--D-alanine ligase [Deltaproteobacteria bacterium]|nr:D-alanine--D-alanine ligase [Deltaproteobacteria bacterium]
MKSKRIGVLLGGTSEEREISLKTGEAIFTALHDRGYDVRKVYVDSDIDAVLRQSPIDVAFLALHGRFGEDGCIQGLLEIMGIPYTGSGVLASALAMDKLKAKEMFRLHNVPTPPYYHLDGKGLAKLEEVHGSFGYPVVVKPRRQGSSIGVGRANDLASLQTAVEDALRFDRHVLVERFIRGREIAVGILDGKALGAIEIAPKRAFYDYTAKYRAGMSEYFFPARLSPARYRNVCTIAERASACLDCSGATRVDVIATEGENEYVLEVNTLPGMTPTSLLPKIAAAAGHDFGDLCEAILRSAIQPAGARSSRSAEMATTTTAVGLGAPSLPS